MNLKNKIGILPFLMALLIIPITMRLVAVPIPYDVQLHWTGVNVDYDIFSYSKSALIIVTAVATALILFFYSDRESFDKLKRTKFFAGAIGFIALMAVLSAFFGGNKVISFGGAPSRYEGLYTYIGYFVICIYALLFDYDGKSKKIITILIAVFTVLCALVGFTQFTGNDFFLSPLGTKLIVPDKLKELRDQLSTMQSSFKTMYIFTTHYNYSSMLMAMLSMFWFTYFLATKDKFYKILTLVMSVLAVLMLLGSNARSGIVAVAVSCVIMFFIYLKRIIQNKKMLIGGVVFIVLAILIAGKLGLMSRFGDLVSDMKNVKNAKKVSEDYVKELIPLKDVSTTKDTYSITWKDNASDFTLVFDKNKRKFYDESGNELKFNSSADGEVKLEDAKYSAVSIITFKTAISQKESLRMYHRIVIGNEKFNFDITDDVKMVNHVGVEIKPNQNFERAGLYGMERLGSGRGYIVDYTLPLLKKAVFLGYGPDAFLQIFNQDDIYTKFYVYGMTAHIVDKPHNLYLLYAVNFGVIAMFVFVAMIVGLQIKSAYKYSEKDAEKDNSENAIFMGALSGVSAYMISGFFNDSTVSVSTIFFVFLGMCISVLAREK